MAAANRTPRRKRFDARCDEGASEVVSYVLMVALGTVAMLISMEVLTDAAEGGQEVAAGIQLKQVAALTREEVQHATRSASNAPNAVYMQDFEVPTALGSHTYSVKIEGVDCTTSSGGQVKVSTDDGRINATVDLGNLAQVSVSGKCLLEDGLEFHSSTSSVTIAYSPEPQPDITVYPAR